MNFDSFFLPAGKSINLPVDRKSPFWLVKPWDRHIRIYTKAEVVCMLKQHGFTVKTSMLQELFAGLKRYTSAYSKSCTQIRQQLYSDSKDTILVVATKVAYSV